MTSELKSIKCLNWCTKLPGLDGEVKSNAFLFNGCGCFFIFALKRNSYHNWYYELFMDVSISISDWKPCNAIVQVGFRNEQILRLGENTWTMSQLGIQEIWKISMETLQKNLPSNYVDGNWIKFRFCFEDVSELTLNVKRQMDDKCLQTSADLNADVRVTSLIEDLSKLLDSSENHDAEIKCGECSIKAHKVILCARSEVFKAMFQSDMVEGRTGVVEIQDMNETYIRDFLRYLYTEIMPLLTFEKAKELYRAGDKYAVRSLVLRCSEYFQDNLSTENAFECLALADAHSDEKLIDSIIAFSLEKKLYLQDEYWSPFCEKYPEVAVKAYRLLHKTDFRNKM